MEIDAIKQVRELLYNSLDIQEPEKLLTKILEKSVNILNADAGTIVFWEAELGFYNTIYNITEDIPLKGLILTPEQGGLDGRLFRE